MLVVEWLALEAIFLIEMCLLCPLHQKMSMRLKSSLLLREEFQLYWQSWAPGDCHSPAGSLMLFTVHGVGSHGTLKVVTFELELYFLV